MVGSHLCATLGEDMRHGRIERTLANAAITALQVSDDGWRCNLWGSADHLTLQQQ